MFIGIEVPKLLILKHLIFERLFQAIYQTPNLIFEGVH